MGVEWREKLTIDVMSLLILSQCLPVPVPHSLATNGVFSARG